MDVTTGNRYITVIFDRNDKGTAHLCGAIVKIVGNKVHVSFNEYGKPKVHIFDKYKLILRIDLKNKKITSNEITKPFLSFLNFMWR